MVRLRSKKRDLETAAEALERLAEVGAGGDRGLDGVLRGVLRLGCDILQLETGVIAEVEGDRYRILMAECPPGVDLATGKVLDLGTTFSALVAQGDAPVALRSTRTRELASHPAHETLGYGCYLGAPLRVGGEPAGTLSFADRSPRRREFTEVELRVVELLAGRVCGELERRRLEERLDNVYHQLADSRRELEQLAIQDPATGVLNRTAILARLAHERSRAQREDRPVGVFLMNVDRLREVNTNFGHEVGDRVLAEIAHRVAGSLRAYDQLGRFGGGEFLAILPGCSLQQAAEIAERAREAVDGAPFTTDHGVVTVTGSFGVTSVDDHQLSTDALLAFADKALYLAKQGGRNCVKGTTPMAMASP